MKGYIYIIKNTINNKVYIGKTLMSIEERFKQHLKDSKKRKTEKRPLYNAMNKYGVENFYIEELECCDENILSNREEYWINYYGSYKNGYNATKGGDGRTYIDYNKIDELISQGYTVSEVADIIKCSKKSIRLFIENNNLEIINKYSIDYMKKISKIILQIDNNQNIIAEYSSICEASRFIKQELNLSPKEETIRAHISSVCNNKRKSAYGYKWEFK